MRRDPIPEISMVPQSTNSEMGWASLSEAVGTAGFKEVLKGFVSHLGATCERTPVSDQGLGELRTLAAIVLEHVELSGSTESVEPLSCLSTIERCVGDCTNLSRREVEVCARILFGFSSAAIAADLTIGETTVKTYRKRIYERLVIGCEHELITWYLRTWTRWRQLAPRRPSLALSTASAIG